MKSDKFLKRFLFTYISGFVSNVSNETIFVRGHSKTKNLFYRQSILFTVKNYKFNCTQLYQIAKVISKMHAASVSENIFTKTLDSQLRES